MSAENRNHVPCRDDAWRLDPPLAGCPCQRDIHKVYRRMNLANVSDSRKAGHQGQFSVFCAAQRALAAALGYDDPEVCLFKVQVEMDMHVHQTREQDFPRQVYDRSVFHLRVAVNLRNSTIPDQDFCGLYEFAGTNIDEAVSFEQDVFGIRRNKSK